MKQSISMWRLCALVVIGAASLGARAEETAHNTLTEAEKAAGWKLLFDGKTTAGWRNYKKDKISEGWKVVDGTLVRAAKGAGDIVTTEQYDSFELSIDWKISKGGNSGIMYHVSEDHGAPYFTGPECQIQDNVDGHDPQKAGWCYQLYKPADDPKTGKPIDATKPAGEWNQFKLLINGAHVEHWMNGVKYCEYELWSDDWNAKVAASKFKAWAKFGTNKTGHIDLQDHGNEVAYRNIKIRPIVAEKK